MYFWHISYYVQIYSFINILFVFFYVIDLLFIFLHLFLKQTAFSIFQHPNFSNHFNNIIQHHLILIIIFSAKISAGLLFNCFLKKWKEKNKASQSGADDLVLKNYFKKWQSNKRRVFGRWIREETRE